MKSVYPEKIETVYEDSTMNYLKAFGILYVMLGHGKQFTPMLNYLFPIYSFHIPLFFFIS